MGHDTAELTAPRPRGVRVGEAPTFSVLITSLENRSRLETYLDHLLPKWSAIAAEVIVARAGDKKEIQELAASYPAVRFIEAPPQSQASTLRMRAMAEADGDVVLFHSDEQAASDWVAPRMLEQHTQGVA